MSSSLLPHLKWLIDTGKRLETEDGQIVEIWEFDHQPDEEVLSNWAKHYRNQYCDDNEIDFLRRGTKFSRAEYLDNIKFPDSTNSPGPSIRAGDFGEVLVADYLEYVLKYWVPRTRYIDKTVRNESTKGSDIIGFHIIDQTIDSDNDSLAIFEVKTQFSGKKAKPRLQNAVDDSSKDHIRKAESLNAIKQKLFYRDKIADATLIERFQNPEDRPYQEINGAVAIFDLPVYDEDDICKTNTTSHPNKKNLKLLVIQGVEFMELVHALYRRAADEA